MRIFLLYIAAVLINQPSFAQGEFSNLNNLLKTYFEAGEYKEGVPIAKKAVEAARKEFGEKHLTYAASLNTLGLFYFKTGQYSEAEPLFIESTSLRLKLLGSNHSDYATSLNNLAALYAEMGNYKQAEPLHLKVIDIDKKTIGVNNPDYAQNLHNLGYVYEQLGQFEKAEAYYTSTMEIRKKVLGEESSEFGESLASLSDLYKKEGQYSKAEPLVLQSLAILKKKPGEEHPSYAVKLSNLATIYSETGRYEKAALLYNTSMQTIKNKLGEDNPNYATCLENLGTLYTKTSNYAKAESVLYQALAIRKKTFGKTSPEYSYGINNLAFLYFTIGQYEKAEELFLEVLALRKVSPGEKHPDYAQALNNLATLYVYMQEFDKAEPLLIQSLSIIKKTLGEIHPDYLQGLNNLASLYNDLGKYSKAEPLYLESLETFRKTLGESHINYAQTLNNLAALYYYEEKFRESETALLKSISIRKNLLGESHPDYIQSLHNIILLYDKMGLFSRAEPFMLMNSNAEMKNLSSIFTILSEKEKENYLSRNILLAESNNRHAFRYNKTSSRVLLNNYNQQLFFKSAALAGTRNTINAIRSSSDTAVRKKYALWQANKSILAKEYTLPIQKRRADISKLEEETEQLEKELTRRSAGFRDNSRELGINANTVADKLENEEAAIEFVRFSVDNKRWTDSIMYAAYILNKKDAAPVFVPLCEERQLQKLFDSAGSTATSMVTKFYRGTELKNKNAAAALGTILYSLIWKPMEPYLKDIKKISYSPAGKLYNIAFHALPVDSNTILMDKYELRQYTSTREVALRETGSAKGEISSIALFGDAAFTPDTVLVKKTETVIPDSTAPYHTSILPARSIRGGTWSNLPGTAEEVRKIKAVFEEHHIITRSFTQTEASEENLKALSGNSPQVLHIATHGFFLPAPEKKKPLTESATQNMYSLAEDPLLRSGLVLSGANDAWNGKPAAVGVEDGIATAYEISQLDLTNTELVVLSACESALGDVKGTEGVFGLQRAFKIAGVKKMIVSLWQVPDKETAELMTLFYNYWMTTKNIEEAFGKAQADMRKKYSPFYWAAFVLVE